jgi:hypothetical protein
MARFYLWLASVALLLLTVRELAFDAWQQRMFLRYGANTPPFIP